MGNFSGAIPVILSACEWLGYILSMGVLSSFSYFEVSLLSRPSTPLGMARNVDGIWVLSLFRYFNFWLDFI